jgi:hypothetical protein
VRAGWGLVDRREVLRIRIVRSDRGSEDRAHDPHQQDERADQKQLGGQQLSQQLAAQLASLGGKRAG